MMKNAEKQVKTESSQSKEADILDQVKIILGRK